MVDTGQSEAIRWKCSIFLFLTAYFIDIFTFFNGCNSLLLTLVDPECNIWGWARPFGCYFHQRTRRTGRFCCKSESVRQPDRGITEDCWVGRTMGDGKLILSRYLVICCYNIAFVLPVENVTVKLNKYLSFCIWICAASSDELLNL